MQHFALCLASPAQVVESKSSDFGAEVALTGIGNDSAVKWVPQIVCRVSLKQRPLEIDQEMTGRVIHTVFSTRPRKVAVVLSIGNLHWQNMRLI
jgi:hypothetical protein